jgi:hypothetical protein
MSVIDHSCLAFLFGSFGANFLEAILAETLSGGSFKALPKEFLQWHPFSIEVDTATPRTDAQEAFELLQLFEQSAC